MIDRLEGETPDDARTRVILEAIERLITQVKRLADNAELRTPDEFKENPPVLAPMTAEEIGKIPRDWPR